jgi:hypothetical protein
MLSNFTGRGSLAGKCHRLAAWQKDNEAFIPQQRDEAFRHAISRPENDFLLFVPIREHSWNRFFFPCA